MREADKLDFRALSRAAHILRIDGAAKGRGNSVNLGSRALGNVGHAARKYPVYTDDGFIARLQNVDHGSFNSSRSRRGNRERHIVAGLKYAAK